MTVVGTLTHELGHYAVSRMLGYNATINYNSCSTDYWDEEEKEFLDETFKNYSNEISKDLDFPNKERYIKLIDKFKTDRFWITLGGPLQTMFTGTIGFLLLLVYRKKLIVSDKVHLMGWLLVFCALFWLRQVANLFVAIIESIMSGQPSLRGDEMRLAHYLEINVWTIQLATGIIGIAVLLMVLNILPKKLILTFIISGLVGGVLGYYLWLIKFGPVIMQ